MPTEPSWPRETDTVQCGLARPRTPTRRQAALGVAFLLGAYAQVSNAQAAGTWTKAPIQPTNGAAFWLWLLTDGTVLSHGNALLPPLSHLPTKVVHVRCSRPWFGALEP